MTAPRTLRLGTMRVHAMAEGWMESIPALITRCWLRCVHCEHPIHPGELVRGRGRDVLCQRCVLMHLSPIAVIDGEECWIESQSRAYCTICRMERKSLAERRRPSLEERVS